MFEVGNIVDWRGSVELFYILQRPCFLGRDLKAPVVVGYHCHKQQLHDNPTGSSLFGYPK